jgi:hypothetical protein
LLNNKVAQQADNNQLKDIYQHLNDVVAKADDIKSD